MVARFYFSLISFKIIVEFKNFNVEVIFNEVPKRLTLPLVFVSVYINDVVSTNKNNTSRVLTTE